MKKDDVEIYDEKMISLNEKLYDDFYVQELEARLETDPLAMGGLLDLLNQEGEVTTTDVCIIKSGDCGENSCTDKCAMKVCSCLVEICTCVAEDLCGCIIKW